MLAAMANLPFILVLAAVALVVLAALFRRPLAHAAQQLRGAGSRRASGKRAAVPRVPPDEVEILAPGQVRSPFRHDLVIIDVDARRRTT